MENRRPKDADLSPEVKQIQRAAQSDIFYGNQSRLNFGLIKEDEVKRQERNAKARLATQQKKYHKNFYVLDTDRSHFNSGWQGIQTCTGNIHA